MTDIKRVGDTGIHTIEGNIAGNRAARLTKQRENQKAEYEAVKSKIKEQNSVGVGRIDDKFSAGSESADLEFRRRTVGLVTAHEFRQVRENIGNIQAAETKRLQETEKMKQEQKEKDRNDKRKKMASKLSFDVSDDDNNNEIDELNIKPAHKKITKNPNVETSYLPDRDRDLAMELEKGRLTNEWLIDQEKIKNELLEVVYSYWDGSGHRRTIQVKKGTTVGKFLEIVKTELTSEFSDLRTVAADGLIYIKEDLIIPQHFSFYDLIITKARGKSGPLFHFDVHDDIRLIQDVRVEKDESHPGKVVQRRWYEKNKHIFPASRWEIYDPNIVRESYTIYGK